MDAPADITIFLFDGVTALDAVGPYDALRRLPATQVRFAAMRPGAIRTGGGLRLHADVALAEVATTDILVLPGGESEGLKALMTDEAFLAAVRRLHGQTRWTTSVCTGAFLLAATGLLDGVATSTNWRAQASLPKYGAAPSPQRVTQVGRIVTSAGVTAGIDLGLRLCELVAGETLARAVQLALEYPPAPPYALRAPSQEPELAAIVQGQLRG